MPTIRELFTTLIRVDYLNVYIIYKLFQLIYYYRIINILYLSINIFNKSKIS